jgi:hypothetical protein
MVKIALRNRKTQDEYQEYQIEWTKSAALVSDSNCVAKKIEYEMTFSVGGYNLCVFASLRYSK